MPQFKLPDGAELHYQSQGQGQPLVFIHGVWMSSRFFKNQLIYFRDRCRVITLDLRGHGQSSHVHSGHTVANYARDVLGDNGKQRTKPLFGGARAFQPENRAVHERNRLNVAPKA